MNSANFALLAALLAGLALLIGPLAVGPVSAEPDTDQQKKEWFEDCIGVYEPDADWHENCHDQVSAHGDVYDCEQWQKCFEDEHQFYQTRTCDPRGPNPPIGRECDPGQEPNPVQWFTHSVDFKVHADGSEHLQPDESDITDELKHDVLDSFDAWNEPDCSEFEMVYSGTTFEEPDFDDDLPPEENINVVAWQDDEWPHPGYNAVALTTVNFVPESGEIHGANIELNTADFQFTNTDDPDETLIDLRNTLTHEVGHFLGLDHSPNEEATMYASTTQGELKKRDLHPADIAGLCFIYPSGQDPPESDFDRDSRSRGSGWGGCGCVNTSSPGGGVAAALLLLFGLALLRRRSLA